MTTEETLANLTKLVNDQAAEISSLTTGLDQGWLVLCGAIVFLMQGGFALVEAGVVRSKNVASALSKNLMDGAIGAFFFYLWGYAFCYGKSKNPNAFIGTARFALKDAPTEEYVSWFFQFAFCATGATIVSGAVAERLRFPIFLASSALMSAWIYPIVVHAAWSSEGWISPFNDKSDVNKVGEASRGVIDFAGSGVVHMTGGVAALIGAKILGPRKGRFTADGLPTTIRGHSESLVTFGTLVLFFCWFAFNCGSTLQLSGGSAIVAGRCAMTTVIAGMVSTASAGFLSFAMSKGKVWDLGTCCNACLGGLVAVTAGCAVFQPWAALITGLIAGPYYIFASWFVARVLKIDDPVDAGAVHGFCGMLGVLLPGFLASKEGMEEAYSITDTDYTGVFMGGNGKQLGFQLLFIVFVIAWVSFWFGLFFLVAKYTVGVRVTEEQEDKGLDDFYGGDAYDFVDLARRTEEAEARLVVLENDLGLKTRAKTNGKMDELLTVAENEPINGSDAV